MILAIRIKGMVGNNRKIEDTFARLHLKRKYACTIVREKPEILGMIRKLENCIAYGKIDKELLKELVEKRGELIDKTQKTDKIKMVEEFLTGRTEKSWRDLNIKPFFRLHPPRKGIKSKKHFPKGVLGNNKEKINELLRRML